MVVSLWLHFSWSPLARGSVRAMNEWRWVPNPAVGISIVRVMMGSIVIVAGTQKLLGPLPFAGAGRLPAAEFFGYYIPVHEFVGGLFILFGLATRWVALLFIVEFSITGILIKLSAAPPFGGYESARIDYMLLATAVALVVGGPGLISIDRWLAQRRTGRHRTPLATAQPPRSGQPSAT
jgi:putative oxidoreductase